MGVCVTWDVHCCCWQQFGTPKAAIRVGDWKLLCYWYTIAGIANGTSTGCHPDERIRRAWPQLFNITADPLETVSVTAQHPEVVAQLEARLAELAVRSVEPMQWEPPYQVCVTAYIDDIDNMQYCVRVCVRVCVCSVLVFVRVPVGVRRA